MPRSRRLAADLPGVTQLVRRKPKPEPASSSWLRSIVISLIKREHLWLIVHLGFGLAWIALLASLAPGDSGIGATGAQLFTMLMTACWLPSWALAAWQVRHRRWRSLIGSDLLGAGVLVLLACTAYVPLFFFNVAWFLPLALLPRGVLSELLARRWLGPRS